MTRADRELVRKHPARCKGRRGNVVVWWVEVAPGRHVRVEVHAMAGAATAIKAALARGEVLADCAAADAEAGEVPA